MPTTLRHHCERAGEWKRCWAAVDGLHQAIVATPLSGPCGTSLTDGVPWRMDCASEHVGALKNAVDKMIETRPAADGRDD